MRIIVLGAGVIGVSTAYYLAKDGHEVTVIDMAQSSANGCSFANGNQLSYSHIEPWAHSYQNIVKSNLKISAFNFLSNFCDPKFNKWFISFVKNHSFENVYKISENIFKLTSYSKIYTEKLLASEDMQEYDLNDLNYQKTGILHFFKDKNEFNNELEILNKFKKFGLKYDVLSKQECIGLEPNLVKLFDNDKLVGGVYYKDDSVVNTNKFTKVIEKICRNKYNVKFEYNCKIENIFTNRQKITGVKTDKEVFVADKYVYCLSFMGENLLNGLGLKTDIYPVKGYSLSIPVNNCRVDNCAKEIDLKTKDEKNITQVNFSSAPEIAMFDRQHRVVYSRIGDTFRAAGMAEIGGIRNKLNRGYINELKTIVKSSFSNYGNIDEVKEWYGNRPFRANSIPLICKVKKYENFILNAGHGSLGLTLSNASAKIVSDIVNDIYDEKFNFLSDEEKNIYL